jgi:hypothetical protein
MHGQLLPVKNLFLAGSHVLQEVLETSHVKQVLSHFWQFTAKTSTYPFWQ